MIPKMIDLEKYEAWKKEQVALHAIATPQPLIGKQWLNETDLSYYTNYYDAILGFSLESKNAGDILWGRVQGTESEKNTLLYIKSQLETMGLDHIEYEEFPCFEKQWRPKNCSITFKYNGQEVALKTCMTAFQSGITPQEGIEGEVVFVGEGSPSELEGKELSGKIILLSAHCYPNSLLHSARKAFSRISELGVMGIIVWWQLPGNLPVAGRVGTPMGGDHKGGAAPWISVAFNEGLLIRKCIDESITNNTNVVAHMVVCGEMEERTSGHVLGYIKGKSEKAILITTHVDGYFYAMHDNGAGVAMNMELARIFAQKSKDELEYSIIFHFSGDHEVPGAGGTRILAQNQDFMKKILIAYQIEHVFSRQYITEAGLNSFSNVQNALPVFVSGLQENVLKLLHDAAHLHDIPVLDISITDPLGDIQGFYKPFAPHNNLLSAGYVEGTPFYHTSADIEFDMLTQEGIARMLKAHQYILEQSQKQALEFFKIVQFEDEHLFTSNYLKCLYEEF